MHQKIIRKYSERLLGVHSLIVFEPWDQSKSSEQWRKTLTTKLNKEKNHKKTSRPENPSPFYEQQNDK